MIWWLVFMAGFLAGSMAVFAFDGWCLAWAWKYQDQALEAMAERDALRRLVASGVREHPYREGAAPPKVGGSA